MKKSKKNIATNIAMFTSWLTPSRGGIENLSYGMFTAMKNLVPSTAFSLNIDDNEKIDGVFYSKTGKRTVPVFEFLSAFKHRNKEQEFSFCLAMHIMLGLVTLIIKILYGIPYAVYVHGKEICWFQTPVHKILCRLILSNASFIMANSNFTKKATERITKTEVIIINPAIDAEAFTYDPAPPKPGDVIKLLSIGRLEKRKGADSVIRAVKLLKDAGYNVRYDIIGTGEYEETLRKITSEINLNDYVIFHGRVSQDDKYNFIKECDLFLMPSFEIPEEREVEGFGIVYIEANALGKFVIGGNSGGIADAIAEGDTGYIIDGRNPEKITEAVLNYVKLPRDKKEQLAIKCRSWAEKHKWEPRAEELVIKITQSC